MRVCLCIVMCTLLSLSWIYAPCVASYVVSFHSWAKTRFHHQLLMPNNKMRVCSAGHWWLTHTHTHTRNTVWSVMGPMWQPCIRGGGFNLLWMDILRITSANYSVSLGTVKSSNWSEWFLLWYLAMRGTGKVLEENILGGKISNKNMFKGSFGFYVFFLSARCSLGPMLQL